MSLSAGTRLGPYEILAPIGAGGMGEVYRARDTKLGREVAIKVLPEALSQDKERLARFEREAKLLASLNHPAIATLYGFEDDFLVMELVEGETLAERIARGPIPVDDALPLFIQIAEGLEAAHEKGIIHRDLKPANIKITPEGKVKVLDFGLAKAFAPQESEVDDSSQSPTLTKGTALGAILGTASYMSPEQAKGKPVDKRTDVWAFGCCLFETLTGKKAFDGETATDAIAAVVKSEPDWHALPAETSQSLRRLIARCLEKDARQRLHDIADARLELVDALAGDSGESRRVDERRRLGAAAGVVTGLAIGAAVAYAFIWSSSGGESNLLPPTHLSLGTPPDVTLEYSTEGSTSVAISPDGRRLAYVGVSEKRRLYLQDLDSGQLTPIRGSEGATTPFFSPDGTWLAFQANQRLLKAPTSGGEPVDLTQVGALFRGGTFGADGATIYISSYSGGLSKVSAEGGALEDVTTPARDGFDNQHMWPAALPDGRHLLYTSCCGRERVVLLDLETGRKRNLIENASYAQYVHSGHLVFAQTNSLFAAPFDAEELVVGGSVPILEDVVIGTDHHAEFSVSRNGTLIYLSGESDFERVLLAFDREGTSRTLIPQARPYSLRMMFAPNERELALTLYDGQQDVYLYDFVRGDLDRMTDSVHNDFSPVWTPDGKSVTFTSVREGKLDLYHKPADNSGPEEG